MFLSLKIARIAGVFLRLRVTRCTVIRWFLLVSLGNLLYWGFSRQDTYRADGLLSLARGGTPVYKFSIYGEAGKDALVRPMAVLAAHERIYVSDAGSQQVLVFDRKGAFLFVIGEPGIGPGHFLFPYGLAASGDTLFVADLNSGLISKFDKNGRFKAFFPASLQGGVLLAPTALAVFADQLYVADVKRSRVLVFDILTGGLVREIGMADDISAPNGVAVDKHGYVYVTSVLRQLVAVYNPEGRPVRLLNGCADGSGQAKLFNPRGIALCTENLVYVISQLTNEIVVFDRHGLLVYRYGQIGSEQGNFYLPNGLHLDTSGRLYVVDQGNRRVVVFASAGRAVPPRARAQSGVMDGNVLQSPPDDAEIYRVVEDYVAALVADEQEIVLSLLTAYHRQEWQTDSFLLRQGVTALFSKIELTDFRHTFVYYSSAVPEIYGDKFALLTVEYKVDFINEQETRTVRFSEDLVLRLEGENWRIAGSKRDILH